MRDWYALICPKYGGVCVLLFIYTFSCFNLVPGAYMNAQGISTAETTANTSQEEHHPHQDDPLRYG